MQGCGGPRADPRGYDPRRYLRNRVNTLGLTYESVQRTCNHMGRETVNANDEDQPNDNRKYTAALTSGKL